MIPYNEQDQRDYFAERSFYLTSLVGMEPQIIDNSNYETVRGIIMNMLSGGPRNRALVEAGNILFFATTVGFGES